MSDTASCADQPSYYRDFDDYAISSAFQPFDRLDAFKKLNDKVKHHRSKNFIIDFGDDDAYCAFDLNDTAVDKLLKAPRPSEIPTRWINVWLPHEQASLITVLARQFDFSPRLLGFMLSQPTKRATASHSTKRSMFDRVRSWAPSSSTKSASGLVVTDLERAHLDSTKPSLSSSIDLAKLFDQYTLADEVWHWSSVDWGRQFVCLGYNTLYPCFEHHSSRRSLNGESDSGEPEDWRSHDLPEGKRVWSWLVLCEDKTVITIHEDPFPYRSGSLDASERRSLLLIRRNLINVFRNCSKAHASSSDPAVIRLPLRYRVGESDEETAHRPTDIPGLLFYSLFDDWYGSYSIVFRREHRYSFELDKLRAAMMGRADLSHINRLHHIGRQLSVLKRMYQSYELMIDQVLAKQEATLASLKNSRVISGINNGTQDIESSTPQVVESESLLGVALSSAARVRFERLRHRVRLYALNEIDECIAQKDALVMMNFNLIAIVESDSVERLTRITLLLAKVTILFMPVSLMSAYFSAQLNDVSFSAKEYWMWFGIVFAASLAGLMIFSIISGTFEGSTVLHSMGRQLTKWFHGRSAKRDRNLLRKEA